MAPIDPNTLAALAKIIPGITDGSSPDNDANGIPSILSSAIASSTPATNDFDATKPSQPDSASDTSTSSGSGIPKIFTDAISSAPDGQSAASALIKAARDFGGQPLTDYMNRKADIEDKKATDKAADNPNTDTTGLDASGVPKILSAALTIPKPDFDITKTPPADDSSVPSILADAAKPKVTQIPIAPGSLAATVAAAKATANAPDPTVPAAIRSALNPGPDTISDLTKPDGENLDAQTPELHEPLGHKMLRLLPAAIRIAGIVGGGMEAAGSPNHEAPSAQLFEHSLEAQANRALTARQLDIAQQKANTDEDYRRQAVAQFGLVPVTVPDPNDPTKSIQVMVQQKDVGKYASAQATAGQRERSTTETNAVKLYLGNLKSEVEAGKIGAYKPGINPDNGQYELQKLDKQGNSLGWVENSVIPSLVEKTSNTVDWRQMADGTMVPLPKQTVSGPAAGASRNAAVNGGNVSATTPASTVVNGTGTGGGNGGATVSPKNGRANQTAPVAPQLRGANAQNPVIGFDSNGQQVFSSASDAPKYGLTDVRKVGQAEAEKVTNARSLLPLFNNNSPSDPGILQLIGQLDKSGDLGAVTSRWNEFLAGKVGAGNPTIEALRTKMGLAQTGLMQVHVGARGSSALMEHFADLVNSKAMDASTMKSGIQTELNYIRSKAMLPRSTVANAQPGPNGGAPPAPTTPYAHLNFVPSPTN